MEFKLLEKKENPLLKREEAVAQITGDTPSTPSRKEILAEASKTLGFPEDLIIVDKISTERSRKDVTAKLLVYKNKEDIPKYKTEKMQKRIFGAKAAAPAPAEKKPAA